ncbi:putative salt-induced outer membrane protein YdiY [Pseudomonas duriflava]|uniref:Putative salt-induced outer membrane protein YdiY n=1 Tax=Pseudomonas duriflava TaxID=459528 RepID=A0A562QE59_9PSED|nr:DUF481 domain-containing protein [Pseudomonas duriflava]TWI55024.1 putative salt-induced outer membrane protein YdiY [Pseudomonas duriflava]
MRFSRVLPFALLWCAPFANADTVWLKNGDRLTGTIKLLDSKKLLLQTEYGGDMPLAWDKIKTLQRDTPILIQRGAHEQNVEAQSLKPGDDGYVVMQTQEGARTLALASITQIVSPKPFLRDLSWKGNVDVGLDYINASSADTEDYNIDFKTQARHGLWRHNATGSYNRYESDDSVSTHNYSLEYALDRFFNEKLFWQGRLEYTRDWVEELSSQRVIGTGPGYQFWDNELGAFSMTGLINQNRFEFTDGGSAEFLSANLKWDYSRNLYGQTVQFFTTGEIGRPFDGIADLTFDGEVGVRYKITNWASLNLKASQAYIGGAPGDANKTEYTAGFGITW